MKIFRIFSNPFSPAGWGFALRIFAAIYLPSAAIYAYAYEVSKRANIASIWADETYADAALAAVFCLIFTLILAALPARRVLGILIIAINSLLLFADFLLLHSFKNPRMLNHFAIDSLLRTTPAEALAFAKTYLGLSSATAVLAATIRC